MIAIPQNLLNEIHRHLEETYPEEGVGFLFGVDGDERIVKALHPVPNAWQPKGERVRRYDVAPRDIIEADDKAEEMGLAIVGAYHSHPDHPNKPSETDRERAHPFFVYFITSVENRKAVNTRAWRLLEDRSKFTEEEIRISPHPNPLP
jgi:proteasome lid subunit RPN8/RPN11